MSSGSLFAAYVSIQLASALLALIVFVPIWYFRSKFPYSKASLDSWFRAENRSAEEVDEGIQEIEAAGTYWSGVAQTVLGLTSLVTFVGAGLGISGSFSTTLFAVAVVVTALSALCAIAAEGARVASSPIQFPDPEKRLRKIASNLERRQSWVLASFILLGIALILVTYAGTSNVFGGVRSIPNVIGETYAVATERLEGDGFEVLAPEGWDQNCLSQPTVESIEVVESSDGEQEALVRLTGSC